MDDINRNIVHVVCSSDENTVMPLAVMLKSLFMNCAPDRKTILYLLDGGLTGHSKDRLLQSMKPHRCNIEFIKVDETLLKNMKVGGYFTLPAYYRLLLSYALPQELKKVIYLDVDLIINKNIGGLWDVDIGEHHVLAVQEEGEDYLYVSSPGGLLNYKELGIDPSNEYFNSGVLVINLDKWRKDDIGLRAIRYIEQNKQYIRWWDQDALNAVLAYKWGKLDHRWNLSTLIFSNTSWKNGPIKDKQAYKDLIKHPYIIHFNTSRKPWHAYNDHPYRHLFFHYLDMTEWRTWRPKENYCLSILRRFAKFILIDILHVIRKNGRFTMEGFLNLQNKGRFNENRTRHNGKGL